MSGRVLDKIPGSGSGSARVGLQGPMGQRVGLRDPRGSSGRPTRSQWFKGKAYRDPGGQRVGLECPSSSRGSKTD